MFANTRLNEVLAVDSIKQDFWKKNTIEKQLKNCNKILCDKPKIKIFVKEEEIFL